MFSPLFPGVLHTILVVVALAALIIGTCIVVFGKERVEKDEPPLVPTRIPFVGHMIGLLWHQNDYFTIINKKYPNPISTLKILNSRIYVINSPSLAAAAFKASKTIDFEDLKTQVSLKLAKIQGPAREILLYKPEKEGGEGGGSYMGDLHNEMYGALAQGPGLWETNKRVLGSLVGHSEGLEGGGEKKMLFEWLREFYTTATMEALYRKKNPVAQNNDFVKSIWDFEKDLGMLVLDILPSITAPKGHAGRLALSPAFLDYYQKGLDVNAGSLIQARTRCARKWGLTTENMARAEITIAFAAVTNTVPNAFYMLCHLYSNPSLVAELRKEISKIAYKQKNEKTRMQVMIFDISHLTEHCPLLTSCWNETLRLTKTGASIRMVLEDTMLTGQYLLKKGSVIQIPTSVLQSEEKNWGADSSAFDPYRFLSSSASSEALSKEQKKTRKEAFIPFGGGRNLCPGRHLAFTEVVAFVAMMVLGFDVELEDGCAMRVPEAQKLTLGVSSLQPKHDVMVVVKKRKEYEGVEWAVVTGVEGSAERGD